VVLVDGDLRNPELADRLPLNPPMRDGAAARGLSTTLVGETTMAEAVIANVPLGNYSVAFLPAGPTPPRPGELWATDRASMLLDELSNAYDYVVIDTPPLGAYNDGAAIAALSEGAILLARIRKTTSTALTRAVQVLKNANVEVLGTVVTFEPGHRRDLKGADGGGAASGSAPDETPKRAIVVHPPEGEGDGQGLVGADAQAKSRHGSS
jgi:Mrp family chromosome partitioning ATPase